MPSTPYQRLPGRRWRVFTKDTLWLGEDHLLSVRSWYFTESYRRFYFRDIQAIAVQAMGTRGLTAFDWTAIGLVALLSGTLFYTRRPVWAVVLILCGATYALLRARRANCVSWIQTAVSTERLPSLGRLGNARKAMALIESKILDAQADIVSEAPEEASVLPPPLPAAGPPPLPVAEPLQMPPPVPALTPVATPPPLPGAAAPQKTIWHQLAFALTLVAGGVKLAATSTAFPLPGWALPPIYLAAALMGAAAFIFRQNAARTGMQKWASSASLVSSGTVAMFSEHYMQLAIRQATDKDAQRVLDRFAGNMVLERVAGIVLIGCAIWGFAVFRGEGDKR
jgi:hypothetical protein